MVKLYDLRKTMDYSTQFESIFESHMKVKVDSDESKTILSNPTPIKYIQDNSNVSSVRSLNDNEFTSSNSDRGVKKNPTYTFDNFTPDLINMIYNEVHESGYSTPSENFVRALLIENRSVTMSWLNTVFLEYFYDKRVLIGILHLISHFNYKDVYPEGQTMAMAGLLHENIEVRDFAIKAFENWESPDSITILKNIKCPEPWLQKHVDRIIHELEESLH